MILDARNGKETWSFREDAAVFVAVYSDPATVHRAFLDEGFAANGQASGRFIRGGPESVADLVTEFQEGFLRSRGLARGGQVI